MLLAWPRPLARRLSLLLMYKRHLAAAVTAATYLSYEPATNSRPVGE